MFLFRLVYYSRNQVTKLGQSVSREIRSILDSCTRNNAAASITGALIFNDQYFAQIIEGDRVAVTSIFCKIARDPRHTDVVIVEAKPIDERLFIDWSMAYAGHSEAIDRLYIKHSITIGLNPARMTAQALSRFIFDLVASDARVAHTAIGTGQPGILSVGKPSTPGAAQAAPAKASAG